MKPVSRRHFLKITSAAVGGAALAPACPGLLAESSSAAPSETVPVGVIGLGGIGTVGGVGGRGRQLIDRLRRIPGARIVALCDLDQEVLDHSVKEFKEAGMSVAAYGDPRRVFDDPAVHAVVVATPNHWHALATVWACQAGKDVYVEKPFSYSIWEGRQMVAAAQKHGRMLQVGMQSRSSRILAEAFEYLHRGELGKVRSAHALVYRPRESLGRVTAPTPIPASVDYDLWCGPAPKGPLLRKQLHYEWHWFWATGNGEVGNNGVHVIDVCRWALQVQKPSRAFSVGGRFAFDDCGETPNTQVAFLEYSPAPIVCEVRNVRVRPGADAAGKFRNRNGGVVIDCEGGWLAGDSGGVTVFDREGRTVRQFKDGAKGDDLEVAHLSNFLEAVRTRKASALAAGAAEGHASAVACHMANISYRVGRQSSPEAILEQVHGSSELTDAYDRCREHLRTNGIDLGKAPATLGQWVSLDPQQDQFVGPGAAEANPLTRRPVDRPPYVVPSLA